MEQRTDNPTGFTFLPVAWWWYALHPFDARKMHAKVAFIAYVLRHQPERVKTPRWTRLCIEHYPLYWLLAGIKITGKRVLCLLIILVILAAALGYITAIARHISITVK